MTTTGVHTPLSELLEAIRQPSPGARAESRRRPCRVIVVSAAHGGAGASTVALALADRLAGTTPGVALVAGTPSGGLLGVTTHEVAGSSPGWHTGVRATLRVECPAPALPHDVLPAPPDGYEFLVIDSGGMTPSLAGPAQTGWRAILEGAAHVVVTRATVPAVARAEAALAATDDPAVLAVVGVRRWPKPVAAVLGPAVHSHQNQAAVVFVPPDHGLEISGIGSSPLPPNVTRSAGQILDRLGLETADATVRRTRTSRWGR